MIAEKSGSKDFEFFNVVKGLYKGYTLDILNIASQLFDLVSRCPSILSAKPVLYISLFLKKEKMRL